MDLQALVDQVGVRVFDVACDWAWRTAAGTGKSGQAYVQWPDEVVFVPHQLANLVWLKGVASSPEGVALAFELYRRMPCYAFFTHAQSYVPKWDDETRAAFWSEYRILVNDEDDRLADPVCYSLWCDYFENNPCVEEAWRAVTRRDLLSERGLARVLDVSGPVPWSLKAPLYEQLVPDAHWHATIFRSVLYSAFDAYGSLDEDAARDLLVRLNLSETTEHLATLREKLGLTVPKPEDDASGPLG